MGSSKRSFAMLANTLLLGSSFPTTIGGGGEFRISVKVGNSLKLICNTNEDFSSCIFFSPQKEKFDIGTDGGEGFSNPRVRMMVHKDSNPSRTCGIHINQVTAEDEGVWRCEVQFERINGVGTANASQYVHVHGGEVVNPGWEFGWCNDKTDKDQNSGVINLVFPGSKTTIDKCLELCKNKEGATGCEFHPHWGCSVHTKSVSGGEKDPKAKDYRCHPLSGMECQKLNVTGADYGGCNGVYAVSTQDTLQDEGRKHLPVYIKEEGDMRNHGHGSCTMLFYMHGYGWSLGPKSKVANGYYHYSGISQSKMPWEQTWKNKDIVVKCG